MPVRFEDIGASVREAEYAVRGPIVARAQELERGGRDIVYCNIGNPQALGQRPLTWVRQCLALSEYPELLEEVPAGTFPADVVEVAGTIAFGTRHGLGAYTDSNGLRFVREAVARFIADRDGIAADPDAISLTDGASKGAQAVLRILIGGPTDGVLIPIPQYPLYSATITLYGGAQVPYHVDESAGWALSPDVLERAVRQARDRGVAPRAIVVINPGNPTGAVLDEASIEMVLGFAQEHDLAVLADEVYQENVYRPDARFVSFASVLERAGIKDVSLFSVHSTSKGLLGECGHRGGYLECRNVPRPVLGELGKLASISLCANTAGQIVTYLMVTPPRPDGPSYATYQRERAAILGRLRVRAAIVEEGLNAVPGIHCNPVAGAMYAFPRLTLPPGVTDVEYCLALLEETGVCVVPGSGFGQPEGTWHLRTTILPQIDRLEAMVARLAAFHERFTQRRR